MNQSALRRTAIVTVFALTLASCGSEAARLEKIYQGSASGRSQTAGEIRKGFFAKQLTLNEAINLAHAKLDAPAAGEGNPVLFAAGVLDCLAEVEPEIAKANVNELFWTRVGTLAGKAAAVARDTGDNALARDLVLGGTEAWQSEGYWRIHPAHDAAAAIILFENGEGKIALERLRSRPELSEETQKAYDDIEKAMRKARGG